MEWRGAGAGNSGTFKMVGRVGAGPALWKHARQARARRVRILGHGEALPAKLRCPVGPRDAIGVCQA
jgi:hypothetical protein